MKRVGRVNLKTHNFLLSGQKLFFSLIIKKELNLTQKSEAEIIGLALAAYDNVAQKYSRTWFTATRLKVAARRRERGDKCGRDRFGLPQSGLYSRTCSIGRHAGAVP